MTLTGIAADLRNRDFRVAARRIVAVAAMLAGAVAGALLVLHATAWAAMFVACGLVAAVLLAVALASRRPAPWQHA